MDNFAENITHAINLSTIGSVTTASRVRYLLDKELRYAADNRSDEILFYGDISDISIIRSAINRAVKSDFKAIKAELYPQFIFNNYNQLIHLIKTLNAIHLNLHNNPHWPLKHPGLLGTLCSDYRKSGPDKSFHVKLSLKTIGPEKMGQVLAACRDAGIVHFVVDAHEDSNAPRRGLAQVFRTLARTHDATIQVQTAHGTSTFHGQSARALQSQDALVHVPGCYAGGAAVALGAVFQLNFKCNQHCFFCTADRTLPRPNPEFVQRTLDGTLQTSPPRVVFTGGEPTLDPRLRDYIAQCRDAGVFEVSVYTNGMKCADPTFAQRLARAGMDLALVSLHAPDPALADCITRCAGGFVQTTAGLDNLLGAGVFTLINYVVNAANFRRTPEFVKFVAARFPGAVLDFSYVAPVMESAAKASVVPRFREAVPFLESAMDLCSELGVLATGLEPHWGVPPCVFSPGMRRRYFPLLAVWTRQPPGFVRAPACAACGLARACPGVRTHYAALYGTGEINAVESV